MENKYEFDFDKWQFRVIDNLIHVRTLGTFLRDNDNFKDFFIKNWKTLDADNNKVKSIDSIDNWEEFIKSTQYDQHKRFLNLQLVYLSSLIESLFQEVFLVIFLKNKSKIEVLKKLNLIDKTNFEKVLGINLKDLIESEEQQIQYYLEGVAKRAAEICNNGKYEKILSRFTVITGYEFEQESIDIIQDIQIKRNEILHDLKFHKLELDYFFETIPKVASFITELARMLLDCGIEIKHEFFDKKSINIPNQEKENPNPK